MNRAPAVGSARDRAYGALADMERKGWIARYQATQFPNRKWGFHVWMPDGADLFFLPREAVAFAEGFGAGYGKGRDDEAANEPALTIRRTT